MNIKEPLIPKEVIKPDIIVYTPIYINLDLLYLSIKTDDLFNPKKLGKIKNTKYNTNDIILHLWNNIDGFSGLPFNRLPTIKHKNEKNMVIICHLWL